MKRFAFTAGLALVAIAPAATARDLPEIRAQGTLRWGGDLQGGEPYVFEDPEHPGAIIGFEVDIVWKDGRLVSANVRSLLGNAARLRYGAVTRGLKLGRGGTLRWDGRAR